MLRLECEEVLTALLRITAAAPSTRVAGRGAGRACGCLRAVAMHAK